MKSFLYFKTCHIEQKDNIRISAFDLDKTIIKTKSGNIFPNDGDDWEFLYENTKSMLEKLSKKSIIVIFTNQNGLVSDMDKRNDWIRKIKNIINELSIDIHILVAFDRDNYRKPSIGLFELFLRKNKITKEQINWEKSFYVGDAAGRPDDFSDSDYYFAKNTGLNFYIPEQLRSAF